METRRFIATTPVNFLYRISAVYLRHGYYRYKFFEIPQGKDVGGVEQKLVDCYDITTCRMKRARRKRQGLANVVFVRYERQFVLMATGGRQAQFDRLTTYDFRTTPFHFHDYSVGLLRHIPCVRVRQQLWCEVEKRLIRVALKHSRQELKRKIGTLPYANFPGVYWQKIELAKQIDKRRRRAGLSPLNSKTRKPKATG